MNLPCPPPIPPPWRLVAEVPIGGLYAIGFAAGSEDVLVVSQDGRGLIRATTGNRVARDYDHSWSWYAKAPPTAQGIGPCASECVAVSGVDGGRLLTETPDGWFLVLGKDVLAIVSPDGQRTEFSPRWQGEPVRAFSFSPSGRSLAVAVSSHTLELYTRH